MPIKLLLAGLFLVVALVPTLAGQLSQSKAITTKHVLSAPWGKEPGAFGMDESGARLGPSAFALFQDRIHVLDRVHGRVQIFDKKGKLLQVIPLGSKSVDMLALDGTGKVLVLDAFVKKEIHLFKGGKRIGRIPLPEKGRSMVTALFAGTNLVFIEWDHISLTSLPCPGLRPYLPKHSTLLSGKSLPGRPLTGGWVRAARTSRGIALTLGGGMVRQPTPFIVPVERGVECLLELLADPQGRILIAYFTSSDPARRIQVLILDEKGKSLSSFALEDDSLTDLYTRLAFDEMGRLYQLSTSKGGVTIKEVLWMTPRKAPKREGAR